MFLPGLLSPRWPAQVFWSDADFPAASDEISPQRSPWTLTKPKTHTHTETKLTECICKFQKVIHRCSPERNLSTSFCPYSECKFRAMWILETHHSFHAKLKSQQELWKFNINFWILTIFGLLEPVTKTLNIKQKKEVRVMKRKSSSQPPQKSDRH